MDKLIVYLNFYQQPEAYSNFHITFIDNFRSFKLNQLKKPDAYSESSRLSTMELFCDNS